MIFSEHDIARIWRGLEEIETKLRRVSPPWSSSPYREYDSMGRPVGRGQSVFLTLPIARVQRVRDALRQSARIAKDHLTSMLAGVELESIWGILLAIVEDMALYWGGSVLAGTAVGGAIGFLGFGAGALPGAVIGAAAGNEVGLWVLAFLGLKALAVSLVSAAVDAAKCYQKGFEWAWGPTEPNQMGFCGGTSDACVAHGAHEIAQGHVLMVMAILTALIAYLTMGRGVSKAAALAEISANKRLGPRIAQWLEKNEEQLARHPQLQPRQPSAGGAGKPIAEEVSAPIRTTNAEKAAKPKTKNSAPEKLKPGTPEHKADRWAKYQGRSGKKDYDQWSKQYETNMRNYQHGMAREAEYRAQMGASQGTLKTPLTYRQVDILKTKESYAGQLKTGPVSLTKENKLAIAKDAELVKRNWQVEHILEKGASNTYLNALKDAGIKASIGPQIP
jgi:hypothetical protein